MKMSENTRASKRSYDMAFKQKVIACADKGSNRGAARNYRHDCTEINKRRPQIDAAPRSSVKKNTPQRLIEEIRYVMLGVM